MIKRLIIMAAVMAGSPILAGPLYAADTGIAAVSTGNWSNAAIWSGGKIPASGQKVIIQNGVTVTVDQNITVGGDTDAAAITVAAGGILVFDTSNNCVITVKGDIDVYGVLAMRAGSGYTSMIQFNCSSNAEFGLKVQSGGFLDVEGASCENQNCAITALPQNGSHNGYIYCMDGSKTKLKYADISYMGKDAGTKYGIYVDSINNAGGSEYFCIEGSKVRNGYDGVYLNSGANCVVLDNKFYSLSHYGIYAVNGGNSVISYNQCCDNIAGIVVSGAENDMVMNNIANNNSSDGILVMNSAVDTKVYNNTIYRMTVTGAGININASGVTGTAVKNNIISGVVTGISNSGISTTIDYNLFYGNVSNGSLGSHAVTGQNPNFVSTDSSNVNFMFLASDSPALGAGCRLDMGVAETYTNIGARLGYVLNTADNKKFNFIQQAHDDASIEQPLTTAHTITTYVVDLVTGTIQGGVTAAGAIYVKFNVGEAVVTANDQYIGRYMYVSSGANKGKYYLIVDSAEGTTDTITIFPNLFSGAITAGFNANDSFTIVDRVYDRDSGLGKGANLYLTKDGTAVYPLTWNTSGTVIVDAKHLRNFAIYAHGMNYSAIQGFICEHANNSGICVGHSCCSNTVISNSLYSNDIGISLWSSCGSNTCISNNSYSNSSCGIYLLDSCSNNVFISNNIYSNAGDWAGIMVDSNSNNNTFISNDSYSNNSSGILLSNNSGSNTFISNNCYSNGSSGISVSGNSSNNTGYNNTIISNASGIFLNNTAQNNILKNNLIAYNSGYGIRDNDNLSKPANSYNDLYGNVLGASYQITAGAGTINIDPNFYTFGGSPVYFSGGVSGANTIVLTVSGWTADKYAGYVLWAGKTGSSIFRRIESNTAANSGVSTVTITGTWPAAMDSVYTYKVINWTVQAQELLGGGCHVYNGAGITAGDVSSVVNIGSERGYVKNVTDNLEFNFLQAANDAVGVNAGDTITIYGIDYRAGALGPAITDMGQYIEVQVGNGDLTIDGDYRGYYLFIASGTNSGKSYLIIDSDADYLGLADKLMLYTSAAGFKAGDAFTIVDRVYNKRSHAQANFCLTKSGALNGRWITLEDNGTVILDAENLMDYNVYAQAGLSYVRLKDSIKFLNYLTNVLGGEAITNQSGGYYKWGDADSTTSNGSAASANIPISGLVMTEEGKRKTEDGKKKIKEAEENIDLEKLLSKGKRPGTGCYDVIIKLGDNVLPDNPEEDARASFKDGDIVLVMPHGHNWSDTERSSFLIVEMYLTQEEADGLMRPKETVTGETNGSGNPIKKIIGVRKHKFDLNKLGFDKKHRKPKDLDNLRRVIEGKRRQGL